MNQWIFVIILICDQFISIGSTISLKFSTGWQVFIFYNINERYLWDVVVRFEFEQLQHCQSLGKKRTQFIQEMAKQSIRTYFLFHFFFLQKTMILQFPTISYNLATSFSSQTFCTLWQSMFLLCHFHKGSADIYRKEIVYTFSFRSYAQIFLC